MWLVFAAGLKGAVVPPGPCASGAQAFCCKRKPRPNTRQLQNNFNIFAWNLALVINVVSIIQLADIALLQPLHSAFEHPPRVLSHKANNINTGHWPLVLLDCFKTQE